MSNLAALGRLAVAVAEEAEANYKIAATLAKTGLKQCVVVSPL
jgi:hypothetical protein